MRSRKSTGGGVVGLAKRKFGACRNCGHEVVMEEGAWKHHITRSALRHTPHWPTGHVITDDCKREGCGCAAPALDEGRPVREKMVFLGAGTSE